MHAISKTLLTVFSFLVFTPDSFSQTLYSARRGEAMIFCDSSSRSTLISSLFDKRGDLSQLLATGMLTDANGVTQCRSLLAFDYSRLPARFKPENIVEAKLLLYPLLMENEGSKESESIEGEIVIKRVLQSWNDSLTTWANQPVADETDLVSKKIKASKEEFVEINVTKQVKQMMKEGNNGFMISSPVLKKEEGAIQWFASAKHVETMVRPVLVIRYEISKIPFSLGDSLRSVPVASSDRRVREEDEEYNRALNNLREGMRKPGAVPGVPKKD